jgi:hypothetical protein
MTPALCRSATRIHHTHLLHIAALMFVDDDSGDLKLN